MRRTTTSRRRQGGWIQAAIAAAGAIGSALLNKKASKDASKKANKASYEEERALKTQTDLALVNNARAQEAWDEYADVALPAKRKVLDLASQPINPNVEAATAGADYSLADAVRGGTLRRKMQRAGIDPSSGAALESERLGLLDSTAGKAAAMTTARRGAKDRYLQRLGVAAGQFEPLVGGASSFSGQANAGLSDVANSFGSKADKASDVASAAGAEFGGSLADLMGQFQSWWGGGKSGSGGAGLSDWTSQATAAGAS